jgi:hypothetical protein
LRWQQGLAGEDLSVMQVIIIVIAIYLALTEKIGTRLTFWYQIPTFSW